MDSTQDQHERAVAEKFVGWLNQTSGSDYRYHARGGEPPDFLYRDGDQELPLEVTAAYYDSSDATMRWQDARGVPGARQSWMSSSPDKKLVHGINCILKKKCGKEYPEGCVLLVALYPDITSAEQFQQLLPEILVPPAAPFAAIYLAGDFPGSSRGSRGGYHCWKVV